MKRVIVASRTAEWQEALTEAVYDRLCNCTSTKRDIVPLTKAFYQNSPKVQKDNMSKEDCLIYMLEWVLDWNGGTWDYTNEEYQDWLRRI